LLLKYILETRYFHEVAKFAKKACEQYGFYSITLEYQHIIGHLGYDIFSQDHLKTTY